MLAPTEPSHGDSRCIDLSADLCREFEKSQGLSRRWRGVLGDFEGESDILEIQEEV